MIHRVMTVLRRKAAAHRLGLPFTRSSTFRVPAALPIDGRLVSLAAPPDAGTTDAFIDIFLDDCYRLRSLREAPRTIVDIGAHAGFFSWAARREFPGATIHAYEPNPAVRKFLQPNARHANVIVHDEAVGENDGTVRLDVGEQSVLTRVAAGGLPVRQTAFREVVRRLGGSIDLVKMDCEGAEWGILQDRAAWQSVRWLTMEYHLWSGYSFSALLSAVAGIGMRVKKFDPPRRDFGVLLAGRED
jgi:FkbM family methyltransferase